ncbi:reverse transcriptase [Gossypium australe]|uniref:Reverse transcriptase n=1 Tax=Gossypium australe TaxID=47621 RepID=A0A5B6VUV8_9ROSI|nr:reverse transcriptase [Gossypium australe]
MRPDVLLKIKEDVKKQFDAGFLQVVKYSESDISKSHVLVSLNGDHHPFTSKLDFDCMNNMAEYEACIMGIRVAIELKIKVLEVYGDSALVIYQLKGEWEMRDPKLTNYQRLNHEYPDQANENDKKMLRRLANDYVLDGKILYKRRKDQMLLRCVDAVEAKKILEEVHKVPHLQRQIHVPPSPLHVMTSPWPFYMLGMNVTGPILTKASNEHQFIFVVINYFTKTTTEATPFSLVYRMEAVLPIEAEIPSFQVLSKLKLDEAEWIQS